MSAWFHFYSDFRQSCYIESPPSTSTHFPQFTNANASSWLRLSFIGTGALGKRITLAAFDTRLSGPPPLPLAVFGIALTRPGRPASSVALSLGVMTCPRGVCLGLLVFVVACLGDRGALGDNDVVAERGLGRLIVTALVVAALGRRSMEPVAARGIPGFLAAAAFAGGLGGSAASERRGSWLALDRGLPAPGASVF